MKRQWGTRPIRHLKQVALLLLGLPVAVLGGTLDLTTVPLTTATNTSVKPNLMFILDNSGSMGWDYMPDWVNDDDTCKSTSSSYSDTHTATIGCRTRMPPYNASAFNGAYYNPETTYLPPKAYDGTEMTSYTGLNANGKVPYDAYGKVRTDSIYLQTQFPDQEYCRDWSKTDCLRADNYLLPGEVGGQDYKYLNNTTASGSARFATGAVGAASISAARDLGPYYYIIVPGEYCTDAKLTDCATQDEPTSGRPYPGTLRWCTSTWLTNCQAVRTNTYKYVRYPALKARSGGAVVPGKFVRVNIVSSEAPFRNYRIGSTIIVDRKNRTDCTKVTPAAANEMSERECTYEQELKNFANWFAWYQTRIQMMKSSVSLAFQNIDNQYRVGFYTLNYPSSNYLKIDTFKAGPGEQKQSWFSKLLNASAGSGTPLRSTLADVGRIYAGKRYDDPVQYSCQQNFAILTTDGYWNTDSSDDIQTVTGGEIGNMDKDAERPMYEGPTASKGSLADVAKYYYETDLRSAAFSNCTGAEGVDVCENNVYVSTTDNNAQQHMTTFTLGLGIDGTLQYQKDYKTATSGDYYNIKTGSGTPANWPVPVQESATAIDDLWHAAVNGRGTYFSVKNASELADGLTEALSTIGVRRGAGAAAATSSLNPIAGDNYAYVASYTTVKWIGNLEARTIDINTGVVSENATWCVEDVYASTCASPSYVTSTTSGGSTVSNCVTPDVTAADACASGTYDSSAQTCSVPIATSCTGSLRSMVAASTDARTIWMASHTASAGAPLGYSFALQAFSHANMSTEQKAYFDASTLGAANGLSQWLDYTSTQQAAAVGENLVNYLRGQTGYEDRSGNDADNRLFRYREAVMGDAIESQPVHVAKPKFNYSDSGYSSFVTDEASRSATIYIGTNDGMLHAFNGDPGSANVGKERWAFVPTAVIKNMWKLADKKYGTKHANFVNGSPVVADVYDSTAGEWKTILVSGLNGGGQGYFALDITKPDAPSLLWEIDSSMDTDIGYTYGAPLVTKQANGTWVVLFTSGYNNTSDGRGYLYIRNALTGAAIDKISTGAGSATTPSGLAKISGWALDPMKNNTTTYVYGGDLLGNVWRFDINTTDSSEKVKKFAVLKDGSGNLQPVTTEPEMAKINGQRVVIVGTGKYVEVGDLTDTRTQTLYAISDDDSGAALVDPRSSTLMVEEILSNATSGSTRNLTVTAVDWATKRGWYADFPDAGERAHVNPVIDGNYIFVATTVPSDTVCAPGGYGWLNFLDYTMSTDQTVISAQKFDGPIVGINIYYTQDGQRRVSVTTSNNPTPTIVEGIPGNTTIKAFTSKRAIWREVLPPDQ